MLSAPLNIQIVKEKDGSFFLMWEVVPGADFYEVYGKATRDDTEPIAFIGSSPTPRFHLPYYTTNHEEPYRFKVMAVDETGEGAVGVIVIQWRARVI